MTVTENSVQRQEPSSSGGKSEGGAELSQIYDASWTLRPEDLLGTWSLLSCIVRFADGRPELAPFGEDATGRLVYLSSGHMSATLSEGARHAHEGTRLESARRATEEERIAAYDSYMAYDGTWRLEAINAPPPLLPHDAPWARVGRVIHTVERALTPNAIGQAQARHACLSEGVLTLSYALTPQSGVRRDYELKWRRERDVLPHELAAGHRAGGPPQDPCSRGAQWLRQHQQMLLGAVEANRRREAWSPFVESPKRALHPEGAQEEGWNAFQSRRGAPFQFTHQMAGVITSERVGSERSPYSGLPLGITYPKLDPEALFKALLGDPKHPEITHREGAWESWRWAEPEARFGVCLEILSRWAEASFEIAFSTMHTAGQGYMLAFAGSGANSLDRGLEALAAAWVAQGLIPRESLFTRSFGGPLVAIDKRYTCVPVGPALVFSCGSYPAWNAYPAIMANLSVGNPVIVKPHPETILPVAIAVNIARNVIADAGFSPDLLTLAPDTWEAPIGLELVDHPALNIVDFTGGQRFGSLLESRDPRLQVYSETAGCNSVLLHSTADLDATLDALALGLCLFSAQMCTAPQNLWVSAEGVAIYAKREGQLVLEGRLSPFEFSDCLIRKIDKLLSDPARAAGLCGALHSDQTLRELERVKEEVEAIGGCVLRSSTSYDHPEFPQARTSTPLICALSSASRAPALAERFGPMSFLITAPSPEEMLQLAAEDAQNYGAIASYAYSVDEDWIAQAERSFLRAGASLGINLHRQRPMHFTAAFSDFHVTGLNPAGTACLTDPAFVSRRFRIVQRKREL